MNKVMILLLSSMMLLSGTGFYSGSDSGSDSGRNVIQYSVRINTIGGDPDQAVITQVTEDTFYKLVSKGSEKCYMPDLGAIYVKDKELHPSYASWFVPNKLVEENLLDLNVIIQDPNPELLELLSRPQSTTGDKYMKLLFKEGGILFPVPLILANVFEDDLYKDKYYVHNPDDQYGVYYDGRILNSTNPEGLLANLLRSIFRGANRLGGFKVTHDPQLGILVNVMNNKVTVPILGPKLEEDAFCQELLAGIPMHYDRLEFLTYYKPCPNGFTLQTPYVANHSTVTFKFPVFDKPQRISDGYYPIRQLLPRIMLVIGCFKVEPIPTVSEDSMTLWVKIINTCDNQSGQLGITLSHAFWSDIDLAAVWTGQAQSLDRLIEILYNKKFASVIIYEQAIMLR